MDTLLNDIFLSPTSNSLWQAAIDKAEDKEMRLADLNQLTKPDVRLRIYQAIRDGKYNIAPPHIALIPKDDGTNREVLVNEPFDRVLLSIVNDLLFLHCSRQMIHPTCRSYQKGTGCGRVVQDISRTIIHSTDRIVGFKADLSKYFDSVPLLYIDRAFDQVESIIGHSAVIDLLRRYYHSALYFDPEGRLLDKFDDKPHLGHSLKQGCAVAAFLADTVLYHIDQQLSSLNVKYVRYSDDILCLGPDNRLAKELLASALADMQMTLNPKKVEDITPTTRFKFLGFSIRGSQISLHRSRIKQFQHDIQHVTIHAALRHRRAIKNSKSSATRRQSSFTINTALRAVNRLLYNPRGKYSWATQVLPIINNRQDLLTLDEFVRDCLRAVNSGHRRIGGLGYTDRRPDCCILRGRGRNVTTNRHKLPTVPDYIPLTAMQDTLIRSHEAYQTLVRSLPA